MAGICKVLPDPAEQLLDDRDGKEAADHGHPQRHRSRQVHGEQQAR